MDNKSRKININSIIDSAELYIHSNPHNSFEFIEEALMLSIQQKDKNGEAQSYCILGMINSQINQYDLAIDYFAKSILIYKSQKSKSDIYKTTLFLAEAYHKNNQYDEGLKHYNECLKYYNREDSVNKVIYIKWQTADIFKQTNNLDAALELYNEILEIERDNENTKGIIAAQNQIAEIYLEKEKNLEAIGIFSSNTALSKQFYDTTSLLQSLENKSRALRKSKRYKEELEVRQEISDINTLTQDIPAQVDNILEIGDIYIEQEQEEEAVQYIEQSIELTEKTGDVEKKGRAFQQLSTVYYKKGDYNKALDAYKNYVSTIDEVHKKQKEEILASLELYTKLNRKLERLDMLEKDIELNRKTVDLLKQEQLLNAKEIEFQRTFIYSLVSVLVLLSIASLLIYKSSSNKRKANQLLALKSLRSQMNPHFIYNSLNSINNYISKNDEREANKYLTSFSKLMRSVMDNSKLDFVSLSSEIDIIKLYLQLEHSRFTDKFDYTLKIDSELDIDSFEIPPMLIQPYIENAIWHGLRYKEEKGYLNVIIKKENHNILFEITDNGIGRKKSQELKTKFQKEHKSLGLKNIENRLKILKDVYNYKLEIDIADFDINTGEGTKVVISIPILEINALENN